MVTLAGLFYVYEFMLRVMPSAMKADLVLKFGIQATGFGLIGSLFYWGYTSMQIPAGLLIDRFSVRKLLALTTALCGFGAVIFGLAPYFFVAGAGRLLIGLTSAFAYIGALVIAARWFQAKYFAMIIGIIQFMGSMGAVIGVYPIAMILKHHSWQITQVGAGVMGFFLALLLWLVLRDRPEQPANPCKSQLITEKLTEKQRLSIVLSAPQTWWVGVYAFCSWAPMTIFPAWWGIVFLSSYFQVNEVQAGQLITFIWLGNALASPFVGWWSNRINSRRIPLITAAILAMISSSILLYWPNLSWYTMSVILFLFGMASSAQAITFGLVQDNMPPSVSGTAVGFNNMAIMLGGAIFTPLVGFFLDSISGAHSQTAAPLYTLAHYQMALSIIPLCGLLGLIASVFWIKETNCVVQYDLPIP